MSTNTVSKLYALLIGIDRYSQNELPDGSYYPHLGGCVRDINNVEQMLKKRLVLPDSQITKLLSVRTFSDDETDEFDENAPTYENLVAAFKNVTGIAQSGDQLYIHYSGHGGRCATMFPEIKGENGLDESLVPCDIGKNGACYLRDIEIAYLLRAMDEKGIAVTLVLDSCHSGGATRERDNGRGGAAARGISSIDRRPPPETSAVAGKETLIESIQAAAPATAQRSVTTTAGWTLKTPEKCVLLAACRANELANEYPFDGKQNNGALTYWMLDALNQLNGESTFQMLYNRVVAKVHAKFADQTPQIEGDRNRKIFGGLYSSAAASVNVVEIDGDRKRIKLNTGFHEGVVKGTQFAVFDETVTDFSDAAARLAVVEIETVDDSGAWARLSGGDRSDEIKEGSQAVLLGIPIRLRGRIRLDKKGMDEQALDNLAREIAKTDEDDADSEKWIRLAEEDERYDFQVAVNRYKEYEIRDVSGQILNIRPPLETGDESAVEKLLHRLVHLTKFRNVQLIDNTDPTSPLADKLAVEFGLVQEVGDNKPKKFIPLEMPVRPLAVGEKCGLRITNKSNKDLSVVVMDLSPDREISQLYPENADYELLEAGKTLLYDTMEAALPDKYQQGAEIFKVFAAVEGTSFRWLELPPLDKPEATTERAGERPRNALEELMTSFAAPAVRKMSKTVNLSSSAGTGWATATIEIQIRRPTIAHVADPALSLLQSAFDETIVNGATQKTRSTGKISDALTRPELDNPYIKDIAQYSLAATRNQLTRAELAEENKDSLDEAQKRGVIDVAKYCASMAVGMAKNLWDAKVNGDTALFDQYKDALTKRMGDCDLNYQTALTQFLKFLKDDGIVPYQKWVDLDDFIIEGRLDTNAVIGIVADWGTGEPEALEVLRQVKENHQPQTAIHLGDIYYAGTEYEVENYFYQPWKRVLDIPNSNILSLALPGNHDMYAGGKPFYNLLDKLKIDNKIGSTPASYFCLRNEHWQIIGLDTALHDRLIGGPTYLADSEVEWLKHKFDTANGRRTILLSHHQLFSANDSFDGKSYNEKLYEQVKDLLPMTDLWLWGHEHDVVVFESFMNLERGRCIGGSAFPVGNFEMPQTVKNADIPFNKKVALSKGKSFYHHCYVILKLDGNQATVSYYEDRDDGKLLFEETI